MGIGEQGVGTRATHSMWHPPLVELSSSQQKGAASYDNPIICVSCLIDGFSLVLPLRQEPLRLKTLIFFPGASAGCRPWLAAPFPTNYPD